MFILANNALGDLIVQAPILDALSRRTHQRGGKVVIIVAPAFAALLKRICFVDHIIALTRDETVSLWKSRRIRKQLQHELAPYRFCEAICLILSHLPQEDMLMSRITAQATYTALHRFNSFKRPHLDCTHLYHYDDEITIHQNHRKYFRFITGEELSSSETLQLLSPIMNEDLSALPIIPECCYAIVPGAQMPFRRWPAANFAKVCNWLLANQPTAHIAILGNNAEAELAKQIIDGIGDKSRVIDLTGRTTVLQLGALLPHFRLLISNETGTAHFALALGIPVISILGGGHYGAFEPNPDIPHEHCVTIADHSCFKCYWQCSKSKNLKLPFPCIANITCKQVIDAIQSMEKRQQNFR